MAQSPETETARQKAVRLAWEKEVELVKQGYGTREWSVSQQAEMLATGRVSGFEGSHMFSVQQHPELAGDPNNIQFLPTAAHFDGVHDRNTRNETIDGWFNEETGEIVPFEDGKLPAYEERALKDDYGEKRELKDRYIPSEFTEAYDTLGQSGAGRKQEFKDTRANHPEKSNAYGFGKNLPAEEEKTEEEKYLESADVPSETTGEFIGSEEEKSYIAEADSPQQTAANTYENAEEAEYIKSADVPSETTGEFIGSEDEKSYIAEADSPQQTAAYSNENAEETAYINSMDEPPEEKANQAEEQEQLEAEEQAYMDSVTPSPAEEETNGQSQDNTISY